MNLTRRIARAIARTMRHYILILVLVIMLASGALVGCGQPPYFKASGEPVSLDNNSKATNHTWREVKAFLAADDTEKDTYTDIYGCGHFAERLHNRAERKGFRAAFVVVEFEDGTTHALNAFNTLDYGLVYVDSSGKGRFELSVWRITSIDLPPISSWDKVAYIVEGEKMGFISLGYTELDFSYSWYKRCKARLEKFLDDSATYDRDWDRYDVDLLNYTSGLPSSIQLIKYIKVGLRLARYAGNETMCRESEKRLREEETKLAVLERRLQEERKRLKEEKERLKNESTQVFGYNWEESYSNVTSVTVHW